jgi:hypothetical protein
MLNLNKQLYKKLIEGFLITDCAIRVEGRYCFVLVEDKSDEDEYYPRTRFVILIEDEPAGDNYGLYGSGIFNYASIAFNPNNSENVREYVAVDLEGNVFSSSSFGRRGETSIHDLIDTKVPFDNTGKVISFSKIVSVLGTVYALGSRRKIYRRIGFEQWREIGDEGWGVPITKKESLDLHSTLKFGFNDLSAFAENDMYAVGGEGDVWHFDGTNWQQCMLPTNEWFYTVCCGGDGVVYITDLRGNVWAGRENKWKCIAKPGLSPGSHPVDAVWFHNQLILGTVSGLLQLDKQNKTLVPYQPFGLNETNSGRLDLSPDGKTLLTSGAYGACVHDGEQWRRLFSAFDFMD